MDRFDWLEIDTTQPEEGAGPKLYLEQPHDGATYYRAARSMRESGHFRAASDFYQRALGFDEHYYPAWVELIDTLCRARQYDLAETKAIQGNDAYRQVRMLYASRALVFAQRGNFKDAYAYSDVSLEGSEGASYARCVRAEILLLQSRLNRQEALRWLEEALNMADSPWESHFVGGWMLLDAALPVLAAGYFAEAGHLRPRAPIAWLCLGDCFHGLKLYDQALYYYQRVVELESTHELALERQKSCSPKLFGLMRVFQRDALRKRWSKEFDKLVERLEPEPNDF